MLINGRLKISEAGEGNLVVSEDNSNFAAGEFFFWKNSKLHSKYTNYFISLSSTMSARVNYSHIKDTKITKDECKG